MITAYIEREAVKIVDASGDPVLPVDGHRRLFELTASEMWEAETRQLAVDDLLTLTEIVAEEFDLGGDEAAQLATKVTSYAGFRPGLAGAREEFAFEHEVYFDYFLTRAVARFLHETRVQDLELFLDRGVVPETVASNAIRALDGSADLDSGLLQCPSGVRYDNRRRNLGALVAAYAREISPVADATVRSLAFMDVAVGKGHFRRVEFAHCDFVGADLSGTVFEDCSAGSSRFHAIILDNASRMQIYGLKPGHNVGNIRHPTAGDLYAPHEVLEVLRRLGAPAETDAGRAPVYSEKAQVLIALLHHVARAYRRTNILYEEHETASLRKIFQNRFWGDLKRLLLDTEVVSAETRQTSGAQKEALRLRVPVDQLLTGQTEAQVRADPAADLWHALRSL